MTDNIKQPLKVGDVIKQVVSDDNLPAGAKWDVVGFGIEPSTGKEVCVIKSQDKNYIMCAYQWELKFFRKVNELNNG